MKKTLLVTIDFPPMIGGVANYWANLCKNLSAKDLVVLASKDNNSSNFDIHQEYLIYRKNLIAKSKWLWPKWLPLFWYTWKIIKKEKIKKVIVAHVLPTGSVLYILKKIFKIPYIVSFHGLDLANTQVEAKKRTMLKLICRNADGLIANSNYTKNLLHKLTQKKYPVEIIYPCPNFTYQEISEQSLSSFKSKHGLENKKVLLTVGRLVKRKGHDFVLKSLPQVIKSVPNIIYLIVGSGPELENLKKLVQILDLNNIVRFCSDVQDAEIPLYFSSADLFVMPSRQLADGDVEGFGIVYLEANSYALPVIAGRSGGAIEAVENEVNGLLVGPENEQEIAESIIELFQNSQKAKKFGFQGSERVKKMFTWIQQTNKLKKII